MRDSPSKVDQNSVKVRTANDAVQSIKQLRREIVEIMSQLLCLAKSKNPRGMLPMCNEMITKTKSLLNIWEPSLVEEAFGFIEKHRIVEDTTNAEAAAPLKLSPFRNIRQQLGALELKSPDLEDFATPTTAMPMADLWPTIGRRNTSPHVADAGDKTHNEKTRIEATNFRIYRDGMESRRGQAADQLHSLDEINRNGPLSGEPNGNDESKSLPFGKASTDTENGVVFSETHFDVSGEVISQTLQRKISQRVQSQQPRPCNGDGTGDADANQIAAAESQFNESKQEILYNSNEFDENGQVKQSAGPLGYNGTFLDTKVRAFWELWRGVLLENLHFLLGNFHFCWKIYISDAYITKR